MAPTLIRSCTVVVVAQRGGREDLDFYIAVGCLLHGIGKGTQFDVDGRTLRADMAHLEGFGQGREAVTRAASAVANSFAFIDFSLFSGGWLKLGRGSVSEEPWQEQ